MVVQDAGADATLIEAPRSAEELAEIGEKTKVNQFCNLLSPFPPLVHYSFEKCSKGLKKRENLCLTETLIVLVAGFEGSEHDRGWGNADKVIRGAEGPWLPHGHLPPLRYLPYMCPFLFPLAVIEEDLFYPSHLTGSVGTWLIALFY